MNRFICYIAGFFLLITSCTQPDYKKVMHDPALYRITVKKLNDIILENNFPPMIGSRNYVYANIAAYEVIASGNQTDYNSLAGQIRHLKATPKPSDRSNVDYPFSSLLAFCAVGNAVTFPEGSMNEYIEELKQKAKHAGMPSQILDASVQYADEVSKHILLWSKDDNYAKLRSASKFTVKDEEGRWIPTPPMYSQAIEPHWCEVRPMVLDSASQIQPPLPPPYDMKNKESLFFQNVLEVKNIGDNLTDEQKHIADFWDDNPFKLNVVGHVSFATKKFSPGGHWLNIVGIANQNNKSDFNTTVSTYALASIALFDGFISCWESKFKTNYVRPETVITKKINPDWRPYLQTPPFPEYTSGHAVISAATAEILTAEFGDKVAFRDTSSTEFGIPARSFDSFRQAALEAGQSRVYGGIHYTNSCLVGTRQGMEIGRLIGERLRLKKKGSKLTSKN